MTRSESFTTTLPAPSLPAILTEPALFYDPPYERPLEDHFAWNLVKYLCPTAVFAYQQRIDSPAGPLWVDFTVLLDGKRYGFEIGDLSYTEDPILNRYRDALLVGSGCLDVLYRLRGADVLHRLHDCLFIASRLDPDLFTPRARHNLRSVASQEAGCRTLHPPDPTIRIAYAAHPAPATDEPEDLPHATQPHPFLEIQRFTRTHAAGWSQDYAHALDRFGIAANAETGSGHTPQT